MKNQNLPKELQAGERAMLQRLKLGNTEVQDIEFYLHELKEAASFNRTGDLSLSHQKALEWRNIIEWDLFHQDVIDAYKELFPINWRKDYEFSSYPSKPNF